MYTVAVVIHLVVCFLMVTAILLQAGKGAEIGASFGGTSQTIFGSRGAGTFLSKVTIWAAVLFMITSLGLALLSKHENIASSVIEPGSRTVPVAPVDDLFPDTDSIDDTTPATPSDDTLLDTDSSDDSAPATPGDAISSDTDSPDNTAPATPGDTISSDTDSPDNTAPATPGDTISSDTGSPDDTTPESPSDNTSRQVPSD